MGTRRSSPRSLEITKRMASQTQGIQQLLSAEKRAAEKVSEARKRKNRRLKQAKEEAQAEIEKYKREREQQFGEHEAKFVGSKDDVMKKINADTQTKTEQMNKSVDSEKQAVINNLIGFTCDIKSQVHVNFRG